MPNGNYPDSYRFYLDDVEVGADAFEKALEVNDPLVKREVKQLNSDDPQNLIYNIINMSTTYNPLIQKIYKSRLIILDILKRRGYNVDDYDNFSSNHIQTMYMNKQLDLFLENEETGKKIYIKYHLGKKLGEKVLYEYIDDLYEMEEILTDKDDFIIVIKEKMNDTHKKLLEEIFNKDKKYVNIFNLHSYLFNILEHDLCYQLTL